MQVNIICRLMSPCLVRGATGATENAISIATARAILSGADTAALCTTRRGDILDIAVFTTGIDITGEVGFTAVGVIAVTDDNAELAGYLRRHITSFCVGTK